MRFSLRQACSSYRFVGFADAFFKPQDPGGMSSYRVLYHSYKLMPPTNHMSSTHHTPSTHHISPVHQDPSRAQCRIACLAYSCQRDVIDSSIDSWIDALIAYFIDSFIDLFNHWRIHSVRAHRTHLEDTLKLDPCRLQVGRRLSGAGGSCMWWMDDMRWVDDMWCIDHMRWLGDM